MGEEIVKQSRKLKLLFFSAAEKKIKNKHTIFNLFAIFYVRETLISGWNYNKQFSMKMHKPFYLNPSPNAKELLNPF